MISVLKPSVVKETPRTKGLSPNFAFNIKFIVNIIY